MRSRVHGNRIQILLLTILALVVNGLGQEWGYLGIGELQSWYTDMGCEWEVGRRGLVSDQQDGMRWPATFPYQDCLAWRSLWIGTTDYYDSQVNITYAHKVVSAGPRDPWYAGFIPGSLALEGRYPTPAVYVNGSAASRLAEEENLSEVVDALPGDRTIRTVSHTSIGITQEREIHAYSHPDHDNYFLYDITFTNTGIIDEWGTTQNVTLENVVFYWTYRYAVSREAGPFGSGGYWLPQNTGWGRNTVNQVMGTDPESDDPFRAGYSWHGLHSQCGFDNIGGPDPTTDGHLSAQQFPGIMVLHADTSPSDQTNDPAQPFTTHYMGADIPELYGLNQFNTSKMAIQYDLMTMGHADPTQADDLIASAGTPWGDYADIWGDDPGGYCQTQGFGPYTLAPGESIHIVLVEAVAGLSREQGMLVGDTWLNGSGPFELPDGTTTTDADEYKNAWVFTGIDSLMQTFDIAQTSFFTDFDIPHPPKPPSTVDIISGTDRIHLSWSDNADSDPGFGGYGIWRQTGDRYIIPEQIFTCGPGTDHPDVVHQYEDLDVEDGVEYTYAVVTRDDGNASGGIPLESSRHATWSSIPVTLVDFPLVDADLYVSPTGDDGNDGLSAMTPLKTLAHALEIMLHGPLHQNTIHLVAGTYGPSATGENFPVHVGEWITLAGDALGETILDGEGDTTLVIVLGDSVRFQHLTLTGGHSTTVGGGAVLVSEGSLVLDQIIMEGNTALHGGALAVDDGEVWLNDVRITNNTATVGGGLYHNGPSILHFSGESPCAILRNTAYLGEDIATETGWMIPDQYPVQLVILDSMSYQYPSDYSAYPEYRYQFQISHGLHPQEAVDLWVAPGGDNANDGHSEGSALADIGEAVRRIDPTSGPRIIYVAPGHYNNINSQMHYPIYVRDDLTIMGAGETASLLDAQQQSRVISSYGHENLTFENLVIQGGVASSSGGGIYAYYSRNLDLVDLIIRWNEAGFAGGGLYLGVMTDAYLSGVSITGNTNGGISLSWDSELEFDTSHSCNLYGNTRSDGTGRDIYSVAPAVTPIHVILDTASVRYPIDEFFFPAEDFIIDAMNPLLDQIGEDIYVDPLGSDDHSGTSPAEPFKTISHALELVYATPTAPRLIHLSAGVFSPTSNGETLPLHAKPFVTIQGAGADQTILDAEGLSRILEAVETSEFWIQDLAMTGGNADRGGAADLNGSGITFLRVLFHDNTASEVGGALNIRDTELTGTAPRFINCSFGHNQSNLNMAGAIYQTGPGLRSIVGNSIFWLNGSSPLLLVNGEISFAQSLLEGGEAGVMLTGGADLIWYGGNLDEDPQWVGDDPFDYHLQETSPCIDAGLALFIFPDDTLLIHPADFQQVAPDMGALESPYAVSLEPQSSLPEEFYLRPNVPNPFNPSTRIAYGIPSIGTVRVRIWDVRGRQVLARDLGIQAPGRYAFTWNGRNDWGEPSSAGLYFCTITHEMQDLSIKMLLLR